MHRFIPFHIIRDMDACLFFFGMMTAKIIPV